MTPQQLWQAALGELELTLSKANFTTWFKSTFISEMEEARITISVPNAFTKAWLEKKYHSAILKALQNILNTPIRDVQYRVETRAAGELVRTQAAMPVAQAVAVTDMPPMPETLNPIEAEPAGERGFRRHYTFESFVVGKGNELAHAAAKAVADTPGLKYNPLYLYGGVGLGKTHLLQAIGNKMLEKNPSARVLYVSSEQFTNDYIAAVRAGLAKEFKDRYRTVDLLIVDDIQFLANKESTQEEFFHTFNTLHQENHQVVLSSDRPPKSIPTIQERLVSRLEMGMVIDVSPPDLETRIAILGRKCIEKAFPLDREILHYVASNIYSNVRELEGALNKIIAVHQFRNIQPTLDTIKPVIASFESENVRKTVTPRQLISIVSEYFDITIDDILGKSREKKLAFPRQIIMYLMREEMKTSYPAIGGELGGRDHTTAMHAYGKIADLLKTDEKLQKDLELIKQKLYAG